MDPTAVLDRLERDQRLDPAVGAVQAVVGKLPMPRPLLDALHGVWLGHPAHPMLVQVPVGAWLSAGILDLVPGAERGADGLVGVGLSTAGVAAWAGWADWSKLHPEQQRVGVVHAATNGTAIALYAASLLARRAGRRGLGKLLGFAGLAVVNVGGYLGGHLSYRQAAGANHAEAVPHFVEPGWHDVAALDDLPDGELTARQLDGGVRVCLLRQGSDVLAIADTCSHLSAPLHEGKQVASSDGDTCVECPWHGSTFRMDDGSVVHGPATSPQPAFRTRVTDGRVQLQLDSLD